MPTAPPPTVPQYQLKHRLTGAAVLIIAMVVLIPLVLQEPRSRVDGTSAADKRSQAFTLEVATATISPDEPQAATDTNASTPNTPELESTTVIDNTPVTVTADTANATDTTDTTEPTTNTATTKASAAVPKLIPKAEANANATQPRVGDEPNFAGAGWQVSVGSFLQLENAQAVSTLLKQNGFTVHQAKVQLSLGEATKIWLGPYRDQQTADRVSRQLKSLTGEKGYVTKID